MTQPRPAPRPFELDPAGGATVVEVSPERGPGRGARPGWRARSLPPPRKRELGRAPPGPVHAGRRSAPVSFRRSTTSPACWRPTRCWAGRSRSSSGMALFALTAFATGEIADMRRLSRRAATRAGRRPHRRLRAAWRGRAAAGLAGAAVCRPAPARGQCRAVQCPAPRRHERRRAAAPVRAPGAGAGRPPGLSAGAAEQPRHRSAHRPQPPGPARRRAGAVAHQHPVPRRGPSLRHGAGSDGDLSRCSRARSATRRWRGWPTWSPTPRSRASAPVCSPCSRRAPARVRATRCSMRGWASRRSASAGPCPSWPRSRRGSPTSARRCSRTISSPGPECRCPAWRPAIVPCSCCSSGTVGRSPS